MTKDELQQALEAEQEKSSERLAEIATLEQRISELEADLERMQQFKDPNVPNPPLTPSGVGPKLKEWINRPEPADKFAAVEGGNGAKAE